MTDSFIYTDSVQAPTAVINLSCPEEWHFTDFLSAGFILSPFLQFSLSFREEKINLFLRFEHSSTIYYQYLVQPWVYIDRLLTRKRDFSTSENTITPRIHSLLNKNDSLRNGIPPYQLLVWKAVEIYRTVHDIALDYQTQLYSVTVLLKTLYTLASGYRGINLKLTKKLPLWC